MRKSDWPFPVAPDFAVLTTPYVTAKGLPILHVSHELDPSEGEDVWQFHCGNGDYGSDVLQLVRLDELVRLDPTLNEVAELPVGYQARRTSVDAAWVIAPEA